MDFELKNIDPDDLNDLLIKIEKSFDIKFASSELMHISNFGDLCDCILNKIHFYSSDDCTSQQAFYKLRHAISSIFNIENKAISTNFDLIDFLPRNSRRSRIKNLEAHLGFKLNILRPPHWLTGSLAILLLISFVLIFFSWQIGLAILALSIAGLWFSDKVANELDMQTVGQVATKMARENYLKSRRNGTSVNKNEIEKILIDLFNNDLEIDKNKLTREAMFG